MKIQLQNLTKKFPNRNKKAQGDVIAVDHFTYEIPDGKLIGLLGPSGCGKSTTLNLICGLEKPTEGQIFFGDRDVTKLPPGAQRGRHGVSELCPLSPSECKTEYSFSFGKFQRRAEALQIRNA